MVIDMLRGNRRKQMHERPFDASQLHDEEPDLESEIVKLAGERTRLPPQPGIDTNLPSYVAHDQDVPHIGQVTAEAIVRDYEETAKRITDLGQEIGKVARRCEEYLHELKDMQTHIEAVAQTYRDRGAVIFRRIEESAKMTAEARKTVDDLADKVTTVPVMEQ